MKINEIKEKLEQTKSFYQDQLSQIKTGVASVSMVEDIKVEAYEGSALTLKELATINVPSSSLIIITPWDKSILQSVEKSVKEGGAGLNTTIDGESIKVSVPPLTEEQRKNFVKMAKEKLEEAKISVRNIRQNAFKSLDEQEDNGVISEDERDMQRKAVDDEVKSTNEVLQEIFANKEKNLMEV